MSKSIFMQKLSAPVVVTGSLMAATLATPACALSPSTFVSAAGTNSGACATPATACRTFAFAYAQTTPGGEIRAVGPGQYGPLDIAHSIRIAGGEGVGIQRETSGSSINVNMPASDSVEIVGVSIDGTLGVAGNDGVKFIGAGALTLRNCIIRNMKGSGVNFVAAGASRALIEDTLVEGSLGNVNIFFSSSTPGSSIRAMLNGVTVTRALGAGVFIVGARSNIDIANSVASDNSSTGIGISGGSMTLSRSVIVRNGGFQVYVVGGSAQSAGDNFLGGEVSPVSGTLTNVGRY